MEKNKGYVYLIKDDKYYKIGLSTNPKERFKTIKTANIRAEIVFIFETDNMFLLEKELHRFFGAKRVELEWFELDEVDVRAIEIIARFYSELKKASVNTNVNLSEKEKELDLRELELLEFQNKLQFKLNMMKSISKDIMGGLEDVDDVLEDAQDFLPGIMITGDKRVDDLTRKLYSERIKATTNKKGRGMIK